MSKAVIPHSLASAFFTGSQCQQLDELTAAALGVSTRVLMQRAGQALFDLIAERYPESGQLIVCCGTGNNAGDGYILAQLALLAGWHVVVVQIEARTLAGDAGWAQARALQAGVAVVPWWVGAKGQPKDNAAISSAQAVTELESLLAVPKAGEPVSPTVVVDALLGTGVTSAPRTSTVSLIQAINGISSSDQDLAVKVVAVDIPSGLAAQRTGAFVANQVVVADSTLTFLGAKVCLASGAGVAYAGCVYLAALAAPPAVYAKVGGLPALRLRSNRLPRRRSDTYKHQQGAVVVVGGDLGMGGAVALTAEAALRAGAGLVSVITRAQHVAPLLARCPELMVQDADDIGRRRQLLEGASVVVLGPGLGKAGWGRALFAETFALASNKVVDADGLNLLAEELSQQPSTINLGDGLVVTPHSGEAARLLHSASAAVEADRVASVTALAQLLGAVAVLKGPGTLVAEASGVNVSVQLCTHGNPAMATAGMGDILAGLVAGLWARGLEPLDAAALAVAWHSATADALLGLGRRHLLASELFGNLDKVLLDMAEANG